MRRLRDSEDGVLYGEGPTQAVGQNTWVRARNGTSSSHPYISVSAGSYAEAPPLPTDAPKPEKNEKEDMQDYLDDLLG